MADVQVAPWLRPALGDPMVARRRVRLAWATPVAASLLAAAILVGPELLWDAGLLWPHDGPIDLLTRQPEYGICPAARDAGWLVPHPGTGLGIADVPGGTPSGVIWPDRYGARIENGEGQLLGAAGTVIAREGARVVLGGASVPAPNGEAYFWACQGVEVVRDGGMAGG